MKFQQLFRILKHAIKVLHSKCQQIWKTQQWPQDWERLILIPVPKKVSTKEMFKNHQTIVLIVHASKVMLKTRQTRLQHYVKNVQIFKLDLEKAEEPEIKLPTFSGS